MSSIVMNNRQRMLGNSNPILYRNLNEPGIERNHSEIESSLKLRLPCFSQMVKVGEFPDLRE